MRIANLSQILTLEECKEVLTKKLARISEKYAGDDEKIERRSKATKWNLDHIEEIYAYTIKNKVDMMEEFEDVSKRWFRDPEKHITNFAYFYKEEIEE